MTPVWQRGRHELAEATMLSNGRRGVVSSPDGPFHVVVEHAVAMRSARVDDCPTCRSSRRAPAAPPSRPQSLSKRVPVSPDAALEGRVSELGDPAPTPWACTVFGGRASRADEYAEGVASLGRYHSLTNSAACLGGFRAIFFAYCRTSSDQK